VPQNHTQVKTKAESCGRAWALSRVGEGRSASLCSEPQRGDEARPITPKPFDICRERFVAISHTISACGTIRCFQRSRNYFNRPLQGDDLRGTLKALIYASENVPAHSVVSFPASNGIVHARGKLVVRPESPDIATIIQALKMHGATVDGPTERDGELVYRINEHSLTEHEIRFLADNGRLTTWEIYNYARNRALS
jgi:hypothetical protein